MTGTTSGVKLTYEDFLLFPDDGQRHELIDGEHHVTPCPSFRHQIILGNLHFHIRNYLERHPVGRILLSPFDVVFSAFDIVEPDLLYMSHERAKQILTAANVQGSPELVIEIGSPSTRHRDEKVKRRLYERMDVAEYWIVDPDLQVIRVFRRQDKSFARPLELSLEHADRLTTPLLPDLDLPLAHVFAE